MRRGFTLLELLIVLTVSTLLGAILMPSTRSALDRLAVRRATSEVVGVVHVARWSAVHHRTPVRVVFRPDSLVIIADTQPDSVLFAFPGPGHLGVSLHASRSEVRFYATGVGRGAANTKLVLRRGAAADSVATSRLGRIRRIR